jgi:transketolase
MWLKSITTCTGVPASRSVMVFVTSGLMTMRALLAAEELSAYNVDVAVVHTPTLKPFDADTVLAEIDSDRLAVTLETTRLSEGCSKLWHPRRCGEACAGRSRRSPCPTSFSPLGRCRRCTTDTGCRRRVVAAVLDRL